MNCISTGKAVLAQLPSGLPKGHPIKVSYRYDTNGRLQVRAQVLGTDRARAVEFEPDRGCRRSAF